MCRIPVFLLAKHEVLYSSNPTNNSPINSRRHVFKGPTHTIVILTIRSDKECSTFERPTGGTNFLYFRNVVRKWCGILVRAGRGCTVLIGAVHCRSRCENRMWRRRAGSRRSLSFRLGWYGFRNAFYSRGLQKRNNSLSKHLRRSTTSCSRQTNSRS